MTDTGELILDAHSVLGKGAIWDEEKQVLYWVDIDPGLVHMYDLPTGKDHLSQDLLFCCC
jgi:sugar lactone lactonase YvrE